MAYKVRDNGNVLGNLYHSQTSDLEFSVNYQHKSFIFLHNLKDGGVQI